MRRAAGLVLIIGLAAGLALPGPARALGMSDSLTAWRDASAMDRLQLAGRFGKSFQPLSDSFTSGYFVTCIDEIAGYGNAASAKIEDAMRECVAARMPRKADDE